MSESARRPEVIVRHQYRDRWMHWIVVLTFFIVAASGLALFHPSLFFLSGLVGGGPWAALVHPFAGLAMALLFFVFALPLWASNVMQPSDWQWLRQIQDVIDHRDDRLPDVGKFNAGQKLLYFLMILCMLALTVTGFAIWRRYFSGYLPVDVVRAGLVIHALAAFALVSGVIVHVVAALWVRGSVGAMLTGKVTLGWAYKHHRAWFRQVIRSGSGSGG